MAEQTQAPFPAPPPFYKHFTKENLSRLRQLRRDANPSQATDCDNSQDPNEPKPLDVISLPPELRYLIPPPPPADNKYRAFGISHDLNAPEPSLSDAGVEVLYPQTTDVKLNPQPYLISLARSLLTTFLSLTGVLAEDPSLYEEKIGDLRVLLLNMHDLINQYRPHQARESLILMMEERVERLRSEVGQIREAGEKVESVLAGLREAGEAQAVVRAEGDGVEREAGQEAEKGNRQRQRAAWAALQSSNLDD